MADAVAPGLYFFTDEQGVEHLVSVCKTKGELLDGSGPLFAETFRSASDPHYFYKAVSALPGAWRRIDTDAWGEPKDERGLAMLEECVRRGVARRN